jgi:hypothetical protein
MELSTKIKMSGAAGFISGIPVPTGGNRKNVN